MDMKPSRFTEEQIIGILREQEAGVKTADVCRTHGISSATFYKWKAKYGGLEVSDAKRLKALEDENAKLKKLVAERDLEIEVMKEVAAKNVWSAPSVQGSWPHDDDSCVNVSGLSRVDCCCSQAMMRSARVVLK
jgi:putative transposase